MKCRVCGRESLRLVVDMGAMPLANGLRDPDDDSDEELYPLHLMFCDSCATVQLAETVDPGLLFGGEYAYHSSVNRPYVEQCHALVDSLIDGMALGPDDLVAEIGSNDGYLLARYVERGVPAWGFEPAENLAAIARERGVMTHAQFFGARSSLLVGTARVVHANNVIAHVPDVLGVLHGIRKALAPDGVAIVETPDVRALVQHCQFDTIYHEHLHYWSALSFTRACRRAGLSVVDCERIPSHCGSLRFTVTHPSPQTSDRLRALLAEDRKRGVDTPEYYERFATDVQSLVRRLRALIVDLAEQGQTAAAYGAAAKGAVLLNKLALPEGVISYVVDSTPYKQGKLLPGVHTPIVSPSRLRDEPPDVVLITAWNFERAIRDQYPDAPWRWLVPIPWPHDPASQDHVRGSKQDKTTDWATIMGSK